MKKPLPIILILLLTSITAPAIMDKLNTLQLSANASHIITGQVLSVESHYTADGTSIYTEVLVAVGNQLKGDVRNPEVTIRFPGGEVHDMGLWIEDSPDFRFGENVILFLLPNDDGSYRVGDMHQGKFTVANDVVMENGLAVGEFLNQIQSALR
jgi:hypothetical protein